MKDSHAAGFITISKGTIFPCSNVHLYDDPDGDSILTYIFATCSFPSHLQKTGSSLCLAFGVENSVDFLSSVIVLWRFFVPHGLTEAVEKKLQKREDRASLAM